MGDIGNFAKGMSDAMSQYLGMQTTNYMEEQRDNRKMKMATEANIAEENRKLDNSMQLEEHKQSLKGQVNPSMAERWMKGGGHLVEDYRTQNGKYPTVEEADEFLRRTDISEDRNALRRMNLARSYAKDFDNDKDIQKSFVEMNQSRRAQEILLAGNPVGDASVKVIAARAAGEVGNLAAAEQAVYGGSPALTDWLKRNTNRLAEGTLTDADRGYLTELFDVYDRYAEKRINMRRDYHAERYARHAGIPMDDAKLDLGDISTLGVTDNSRIPSEVIKEKGADKSSVVTEGKTKSGVTFKVRK
jgi:hypothetical protein